jgi:hypothetical protein
MGKCQLPLHALELRRARRARHSAAHSQPPDFFDQGWLGWFAHPTRVRDARRTISQLTISSSSSNHWTAIDRETERAWLTYFLKQRLPQRCIAGQPQLPFHHYIPHSVDGGAAVAIALGSSRSVNCEMCSGFRSWTGAGAAVAIALAWWFTGFATRVSAFCMFGELGLGDSQNCPNSLVDLSTTAPLPAWGVSPLSAPRPYWPGV